MKISVITVSFNSVSVIESCLASVADQSCSDVEHIVIDGASTDGTLDLLHKHRGKLSVLVSEPDRGIYEAMNKGIRHAKGDVIAFLNSDDFYADSGVLSRVANVFLSDRSIEAAYSDLMYVDKIQSDKIIRYWKSSEFFSDTFSFGWSPPHPTMFVKRLVYEDYGAFNLSYRIAADAELMMRFLQVHKIHARYVPEVWVKMRTGGASNKSLRNILVQNFEVLLALQSHGLPANPIRLFGHKVISRGKQFFRQPAR